MPLKLHDLTESLGLQQTTKLSWVCLSIHVGIGEIGPICGVRVAILVE